MRSLSKKVYIILEDNGWLTSVHKVFTSKPLADKYLLSLGTEASNYSEPYEIMVEQ